MAKLSNSELGWNPSQWHSDVFHWKDLHSLKLTWPLRIDHPKRKLLFPPPFFRGHGSFRECTNIQLSFEWMSLVGFVAPLDDWKSSPKNQKNGLWLSMRTWLFGSASLNRIFAYWRLWSASIKCHRFGDTTALFEHVTGLGFLFPPPKKTWDASCSTWVQIW